MAQKLAIGIDFGTTDCCVALLDHGNIQVMTNQSGNQLTPSCVAFDGSPEALVGEAAKAQAYRNSANTVTDVKRLIGRSFNDSIVQTCVQRWPFKVIVEENGPVILIGGYGGSPGGQKKFTPEQLVSLIFNKLKTDSNAYFGGQVRRAVITVPSYFNAVQRDAIQNAALMSNLDVIELLNEPTAAALAFRRENKDLTGLRRVLIYDLGGGSLDVSVVEMEGDRIEIKASVGDPLLGGREFDQRVVRYLMAEFSKQYNQDPSPEAMERIRSAAEHAKKTLSTEKEATIELDSLFRGKNFKTRLPRHRFEELCTDLFAKTLDKVAEAIDEAGLPKDDITDVVLVGGSTRIPKIQQLIKQYFNERIAINTFNRDETVAIGAAIHASTKLVDPPGATVKDISPLSLGIEVKGGLMHTVIAKNTPIPISRHHWFTTCKDNQSKVVIRVYQGERPIADENRFLGEIKLDKLKPKPRGVPRIHIKFSLNASGILTVTATDPETNQVKTKSLSRSKVHVRGHEAAELISKAQELRKLDLAVVERTLAKNTLEKYARHALDVVNRPETESKIRKERRTKVASRAAKTLQWLERNENASLNYIVRKQKKLEKACRPMIEILYDHQGGGHRPINITFSDLTLGTAKKLPK